MSEEKREQKNNKILIIGVSIFSAFFFFLWIFNFQRLIFTDNDLASNNEDQTWQSIQDEFSEGFMQMNQAWEEAQRSQILLESEEFIDSFKSKIEEENNNLEPLPQAQETEVAEDEIENEIIRSTDHCPEYVNCMPTYDELPEDFCVVPPGCEDITLKVY